MKLRLFIIFIISLNNNYTYAKPTMIDFSFIVATVLDEGKSFCHGFFIDNHTIVLPNNCNNHNITTVKKYHKDVNNNHILGNNGLLLGTSLITRGVPDIALLSTKKNIYLETIVNLSGNEKNVIIPVLIDGVLVPVNGNIKKNKLYINTNQITKKCQVIAGTPILSNNKFLSVIDFFDETIPCNNINNYTINNKDFLEKINLLYNCFTKINGFSDIYKNKAICNFRHSS